jgi:uncharacterized protein (TIGR03000 family)
LTLMAGLVALATLAESAQAQVYIGRGGRGFNIGVGTPGAYGQPYYNNFSSPYYGGYTGAFDRGMYFNQGYGPYIGTYYGPAYSAYSSSQYLPYSSGFGVGVPSTTYQFVPQGYYGRTYNSYPRFDGTTGYSGVATYTTPATYQSFYSGPAANDTRAYVRVFVPSSTADVTIDGKETQQKGRERLFHSPPLEAGSYTYTVRASWTENGQQVNREREVRVRPGEESVVRFVVDDTDAQRELRARPANNADTPIINRKNKIDD